MGMLVTGRHVWGHVRAWQRFKHEIYLDTCCILHLDSDPIFLLIILVCCQWVTNMIDNRGNSIYKQDDIRFKLELIFKIYTWFWFI